MSWKGHCKNALFALALASLIAPQAEAIEIFMGANPATHVIDDLFTQVRGGRGFYSFVIPGWRYAPRNGDIERAGLPAPYCAASSASPSAG